MSDLLLQYSVSQVMGPIYIPRALNTGSASVGFDDGQSGLFYSADQCGKLVGRERLGKMKMDRPEARN